MLYLHLLAGEDATALGMMLLRGKIQFRDRSHLTLKGQFRNSVCVRD